MEENKKVAEALEEKTKEAEKIIDDGDKIDDIINKALKKYKFLGELVDDLARLPLLIDLVKDWKNKKYTEIPKKSIISIVGAIIYFVAPIDAIPDIIPVAGYVDDTLVVALCIKNVGDDLKKYEEWKKKQVELN